MDRLEEVSRSKRRRVRYIPDLCISLIVTSSARVEVSIIVGLISSFTKVFQMHQWKPDLYLMIETHTYQSNLSHQIGCHSER
jgi:hypothetical protein